MKKSLQKIVINNLKQLIKGVHLMQLRRSKKRVKCQIIISQCVAREGRILSEIELNNIKRVPDREVCRYKKGVW